MNNLKLIPYPENGKETLIISNEKVTSLEIDKIYLSNRVLIKTEIFEGKIVQRRFDKKGSTMDICLSEIDSIVASSVKIDTSIPLINKNQYESIVKAYESMGGYPITSLYTKEDMRKAWDAGASNMELHPDDDSYDDLKFENLIQSLQQPKKEWEVELEMVYYKSTTYDQPDIPLDKPYPKTDREKYVNILSIK
ncbi:MAG: hypothetical protein AABY22_31695 [Nanoarchaeota archaeon]